LVKMHDSEIKPAHVGASEIGTHKPSPAYVATLKIVSRHVEVLAVSRFEPSPLSSTPEDLFNLAAR
jgi:hypothetical protein